MIEAVLSVVMDENDDPKLGERGTVYRCEHAGIFVENWSPDFDLARKLIAAGFDPEEEYTTRWKDGRPSMRFGKLGEAAKWTVRESEKNGLSFVRWKPFAATAVEQGSV